MQVIRIHSTGFRLLFFLYHAMAAAGFLLSTITLGMSTMQSYNHLLLLIAGVSMVVLPFFLAPPEIMLDVKEKKFVFRTGIRCS